MSNPNRVQPGVPSGGQFASSARQEANVSLDGGGTAQHWDTSADVAALDSDIAVYRAAKARIEMQSARIVSRKILNEWPNATHLEMDVSDQGDESMWPVAVLDADGKEMADAEELADIDDDIESILSNLHDDDGDWTVHRTHLGGRGSRPALDLKAAGAIPDSAIGDPKARQAQDKTAAREAMEGAISAAFSGMSDRDAERFEQVALDAGLIGRCGSCGLNLGLSEKGQRCPECNGDVDWKGADL